MEWFYAQGDDRIGPVDDATLSQAVHSGVITADTLIWSEGMADWKPYATVPSAVAAVGDGGAQATAATAETVSAPAVTASPAVGAANPYAAPAAELHRTAVGVSTGELLESPRSVGVGASVGWLGRGWELFKQAPWVWLAMGVVALLIMVVPALIPFIGQIISNAISVILLSGFYLACGKASSGESVEVGDLFSGFSHRPGAMLGVLAIYFGAVMVVVMVVVGVVAGAGAAGGNENGAVVVGVAGGVAFLAILPVIMGYMFAPTLLTMHTELGVVEAMKLSFWGCLKNIPAFIVFWILGVLLMFGSVLTLFLGMIVLMPVFMIAMFASYQDIFLEA